MLSLKARNWWILTLALVSGDQLTKQLILGQLVQPKVIFSWLTLVQAHNPGVAFGFMAAGGLFSRIFFSLIALGAVGICTMEILKNLTRPLYCFCITLIMAGAIGNLIDRLRLGTVTDFIALHWQNHYFPTFNFADSCITLGATLFFLVLSQQPKK